MNAVLMVFVGAGIGGVARHVVNMACARAWGVSFAWGTLGVNIIGSLLMGLVVGWLALRAGLEWTQNMRLFLATGVLGGFTTFSAFSLDAMLMFERGEMGLALGYVLASVVLSILALALGLALVRGLT